MNSQRFIKVFPSNFFPVNAFPMKSTTNLSKFYSLNVRARTIHQYFTLSIFIWYVVHTEIAPLLFLINMCISHLCRIHIQIIRKL